MSISDLFQAFCANLSLSTTFRGTIAYRAARIVKCLNEDFRSSDSESANRFYVGSYGRNTAIPTVSDVDLLYVLPIARFTQYDSHQSNGQSALLQTIRASVRRTYSQSEVSADGQVVVATFSDGTRIEILGAFDTGDGAYLFPDSNDGGSWRVCKPKLEMQAFSARDAATNFNLVQLGRMLRSWRDRNDVPMSGMLIDTLAYQFMENWPYRDKSFLYYDYLTRDALEYIKNQSRTQDYWLAPGSGSYVRRSGLFEYKATIDYNIAVTAVENVRLGQWSAAKQRYQSIYGTSFPG